MKIRLSKNQTLVLRTSSADGTSYNNFKWPKRGPVKCPDWLLTRECGNGLHGALMGEGDGSLFNWKEDALWQVVRVNKNDVIDLGGKIKFPKGFVVYSGDRKTATDIIYKNGGKAVIGGTQTVGNRQVATAGDRGTANAGINGIAIGGNHGTATVGSYGTAIAGDCGTATAGDCGTATVGNAGVVTTGDGGTATAGDGGTATTGKRGIAIAKIYGKCRAGINGQISIYYWDKKHHRLRIKTGYVGKKGLKPNIFYKLDERANFITL